MSARSYLSIGDVLTLLRQEFPDITISKIRFLESQGLVNPERTPSGYRKFYEHDVERLRWVLRQQREHFLPLKVIKDRLGEDGDGTASVAAAADNVSKSNSASPAITSGDGAGAAAPPGPDQRDGRRDSEPVLVGHRVSSEAGLGSRDRHVGADVVTAVDDGPTLPGIESAPEPANSTRSSKASMTLSAAATNAAATNTGATNAAAAGTAARHLSATDHAAGPGPTGAGPTVPSKRSRASTAARGEPETRAEDPRPAGGNPAKKGGGGVPAARGPVDAPPVDANGASLAVDELAAASGLDATVVVELQEYGLLHSVSVAGIEYFGEDALAVATLAAQFARFGIEPRHLRLYKNAADREAGFVEQIVLPLVRQRNPEARARAHEQVDELAQLGQQLRGALLHGALKTLLDT